MAPFSPPCYLLQLHCLTLYVLTIICHVVGISHHLPPSQIHRTKQTLPPTPATQTRTMQLTKMQMTIDAEDDADNNADVDSDNDNPTQKTDNNTDAMQSRWWTTTQTTMLPPRQWETTQLTTMHTQTSKWQQRQQGDATTSRKRGMGVIFQKEWG